MMIQTLLTVMFDIFMVILILVGVVLVLMVINHYLLPVDDGQSDTARLRHDVEHDDNVISRDSLFHTFLVRDMPAHVRDSRKLRMKYPHHRISHSAGQRDS